MSSPPAARTAFRRARPAVLGLFALWFILIFVYFLRSNFSLVHSPGAPLGVFSGLFGRYTFSLNQSPPLQMLQALIALALTQGFGLLLLRAFDVRPSRLGMALMAYPIGFGISGVFFELLTMAGLLSTVSTWSLWILLLGGAGWMAWKRWPGNALMAGEDRDDPAALEKPGPPKGRVERLFWVGFLALIGLITLATFWHGLFFPETYWDSLILYLGYARMTFLEGAFPFKAEAQVGIGLGANYPHLYANYGAMASTLFGEWSDLHQRLAAPLAGLCATGLVYMTVLRMWSSHVIAGATALLFRAIPYGIAYSTYASDYAFAILFIAAFLHAVALFAASPRRGNFLVMTAIPAVAMHLNYLMGILWVPWALALYLTIYPRARGFLGPFRWFFTRRAAWAIFIIGMAAASPWYIRNYVLTGNPVYAFFPELFPASVRVNPEVLASAELEWYRHGDGVGKLAEFYHGLETGRPRRESDPEFQRQADLSDRLRASYAFWTGYDIVRVNESTPPDMGLYGQRTFHLFRIFRNEQTAGAELSESLRIIRWPHAWKMMPFFPGFFFPALLAGAYWIVAALARRSPVRQMTHRTVPLYTALLLSLALLAYMYFLADFYLYQIIPVIVSAAVFSSFVLAWMEKSGKAGRYILYSVYTVILLQGIAPGLVFGLMNFKFFGSSVVEGQRFNAAQLDAFRHPGMPEDLFYRLAFGEDVRMWNYVNENLKGEALLTHENRHYVYDPSITFIHLDDWEMQKAYPIDEARALSEFLRARDIEYYLRMPKERNHPINRRLGVRMLEEAGYLEEEFAAGEGGEQMTLFRIRSPEGPNPLPPDS